jgi:FkbM family methyltransferase
MLSTLKNIAVKILETHPIGYTIGANIISRLDFLLPHEVDYWGYRKLSLKAANKVFLDLGANLGHSARGFNKIVPGWTILSIEANPAHKNRLQKVKDKLSQFDFKIAAIDSEAGNKINIFVPYYGKISLHSSAATTLEEAKKGIMSSFPKHEKRIRYQENIVETVTIDSLNLKPGIIKIDVQGKELDALEGGKITINQYSPDLLVEVLFNPSEIINYLAEHRYHPFTYNKHLDQFSKFHGDQLEKGTRNLFFSRRNIEKL